MHAHFERKSHDLRDWSFGSSLFFFKKTVFKNKNLLHLKPLPHDCMISGIGLLVPRFSFLKKLFLKTKTCYISNPYHMTQEPQKRVVFIARLCPLLGNFKLSKMNFVIPEDRRFISCKFNVNPCIHGGDPCDQKLRTDRWMDGWFFSFI